MANAIKTTLLLAALTALFIVVGGALDGEQGILIGFVVAIAMNATSYWFSGSIALRMAGAQESTPEQSPWLYELVREVATEAHLPMPRVAIIQNAAPNAFATGRNANHAVVAVTTGIMQILTREELAAVLGHEMGHVRNHDILISSVAATIAGAITVVATMSRFAMIFGGYGGGRGRRDEGNGLVALVAIILAPIAAAVIQMAISRSREYGADATGAQIVGHPEALANALLKLESATRLTPPMQVNPAAAHLFIVNPLKAATFGNLFSTHPPIEERVRRLRQMELRQEMLGTS